jgi:hypothetical protein
MELVLNSDIIDSREIEEEIEELEDYGSAIDDDDENKLNMLRRVREEVQGYNSDWKYGVTLIHERYWASYAMDFAYDQGLMENERQWPFNCINWDEAAKELQGDYTSVEIGGETYWYLTG